MDPREFNHASLRGTALTEEQGFRVSFTLSLANAQALWQAAAARAMAVPGMRQADVEDVIGPMEDPSVEACIAMLADPSVLAGCTIETFEVQALTPTSYLRAIAA